MPGLLPILNRRTRPLLEQISQDNNGIQKVAMNAWWPMQSAGTPNLMQTTRQIGGNLLDVDLIGFSSSDWTCDPVLGWTQYWNRYRYGRMGYRGTLLYQSGQQITISFWMKSTFGDTFPSSVNPPTTCVIASQGGYQATANWSVSVVRRNHTSGPNYNLLGYSILFKFAPVGTEPLQAVAGILSPFTINSGVGLIQPGEWTHVFINYTYGDPDSYQLFFNGVNIPCSWGSVSFAPDDSVPITANPALPPTQHQGECWFGRWTYTDPYPDGNNKLARYIQSYDGYLTDFRLYKNHPYPEGLVQSLNDPLTKWDLYYPQSSKRFFFVPHFSRNALIPKSVVDLSVIGETPRMYSKPFFETSQVGLNVIGKITNTIFVTDFGCEILGSPYDLIEGGVEIGGIAPYKTLYTLPVELSNTLLGGESIVFVEKSFEAEGGVDVGDYTVGLDFYEHPEGGVEIGGIATFPIGAHTGGEADVQFIANIVSDGGVLVNSTSTNTLQNSRPTSGGAIIGGSSIIEIIYIPSGMAELGGSASTTFFDRIYGDGGVSCSGIAVNFCYLMNPVFGGVNVGGTLHTNAGKMFKYESTGEIVTDGDSDDFSTQVHQVSGYVEVSGTVDIFNANWHYHYDPKFSFIYLGSLSEFKKSQMFYESDGFEIRIGGVAVVNYTIFDQDCKKELACEVRYPNRRKACFKPIPFDPRRPRGQADPKGKAAIVPAITLCRQYLYVPPPKEDPERTNG